MCVVGSGSRVSLSLALGHGSKSSPPPSLTSFPGKPGGGQRPVGMQGAQ